MKVGELCAGYGGISMGLRLAGEDVDLRWLAESDPALDPLHPAGVPNLGDVTAVDWTTVEPVDLLTAGFPCQPVSAAGAQLAEADPCWLWPEVRRAVEALRPPRVLLENVRNLISIHKGEIWRYILDDLTGLGYDVQWLTLGACAVGAAHHRHRVFALATRTTGTGRTITRLDVQECGARRGAPEMLPSPSASSYGSNQGGAAGRVGPVRYSLDSMARLDLLPTVTTRDGDGRGTGDEPSTPHRRSLGRDNGLPLDATVALLPTPRATVDPIGGPGQGGSSGDLAMPSAVQPEHWGRFAAAVQRHAATYGPPPAPTEPNRNGAPRLAPAFAEWLMCVPVGHVTDALPRSAALKAIGNGVCPPQLAQAWRYLTGALDVSLGQPLASSIVTTETITEIQQRGIDARGRVIAEAGLKSNQGNHPEGLAQVVQAAMMELAAVWREEAAWFTAQKRKGHVTTSKELIQAAARLSGFAIGLTTRPAGATRTQADAEQMPDPSDTSRRAEAAAIRILTPPLDDQADELPGMWESADLSGGMADAQDACEHPADKRSRLKSGATICTLCQARVGPAVTGDPTMDYLTGATNTYEPTGAPTVQPTPAAENPFSSPASPGSAARAAVKRLTYGELGPLIAATYQIPRPHLSHSYVESVEGCGLSALLFDASRAGAIGPRRPSWSLIGGSAFHVAIEVIEKAAIEMGNRTPNASMVEGGNWVKFWETALTAQVDETKAALIGTPYDNMTTWHVANRGLEGYDWWRVEGLEMVKRYLAYHNDAWRSQHTLLQVPSDLTNVDSPRVPVLEFGFTALAGGTAITTEGRIDAAWLSTTSEYPTAALEVVDYKSGKSTPAQGEHFQLVEYGDLLRKYLPVNFALPIVGRYWMARKGAYSSPIPLPAQAGQAEIDYRYQAAERAMKAGVFLPSVSNFCSSCGAVDVCPAQSMRDGASS